MWAIGGLLLAGCSTNSDEAYQSAFTDGLEAVANEEYSKAEAFFETALKEKKDDEKTKNYLAGIENLQLLIKFQDKGNLEDGLKLAAKISDDDNIPETIKKRATKIGDELIALKKDLDENTKLYTDAEQLNKEKKYSESNEKLKVIQDKKLEGGYFTDLLAKTTELSKVNTTELEKIAAAEKASADQQAKEEQNVQTEAERKTAETAVAKQTSDSETTSGDAPLTDMDYSDGISTVTSGVPSKKSLEGFGFNPNDYPGSDPRVIAYYRLIDFMMSSGVATRIGIDNDEFILRDPENSTDGIFSENMEGKYIGFGVYSVSMKNHCGEYDIMENGRIFDRMNGKTSSNY